MSVITRWLPALTAGMLAIGLSTTATANEMATYCKQSMTKFGMDQGFNIPKFCDCLAETVPAGDQAGIITVMKVGDEAQEKGLRLNPATMPADQAKSYELLGRAAAQCEPKAK